MLVLGNPQYLLPLSVLWVVLVGLTIMSYRGSSLSASRRLLGVSLKGLGLGLLLLCLLEPLASLERPKPQANLFGIVVDNSQSVKTILEHGEQGKLEQFRSTWSEESTWQRNLENDFRVRRYSFDDSMTPQETLSALSLDGKESSLGVALQTLSDRFKNRPMAGMVLFSDGQATDGDRANLDGKKLGFPVYPVRLGKLQTLRDIRIASITSRQSDFEASPVTMTATLEHNGVQGEKGIVELVDQQGKIVQTQNVLFADTREPLTCEFRFRPEESGVQGYLLRARLASESVNTDALTSSVEVTLGNNVRHQVVDRGRGPYRIFYMAGRPNWEHKFLKRALDEDAEILLHSVVRIAKKEPKFSFRDSKVEDSNPLFSGFEDISEEEKAQYSEPVYARFGSAGSIPPKGFPKTAEELFEYQAVILDDIEHDFFTQDQQSLLRRFITERGGGLLVLGGQESMRGTGFRNSVLAQLLPIYGEEVASEEKRTPLVRYELTREGWLHPFLRTMDTEAGQRDRQSQMPPFEVLNRTRDIKPGASVLAEAISLDETKVPALVTQRFGKGKTSALMIGDMWRWGLHHDGPGEAPLYQSWRQMIRWLISDVPKRIEMRAEPNTEGGKATRIIIEVKDQDFLAMDNAKVNIQLEMPGGESWEASAEPSGTRAGQYELTMVPKLEGVYKAIATVVLPDGTELGSAHVGWVYEPSAKEFQHLGEDEEFLQRLATESGGKMLDLEDLDSLASQLDSTKVPITETKVVPLWHQGWILLTAIVCLCGEWAIRRWNGLV